MNLLQLFQELERARRREAGAEAGERRDFERLGLDYEKVLAARRAAATEALQQAAALRNESYQPSLPGINPALMSLRAKDQPLSAEEAVAAGILGAGWQRSPEYPVYEQLELSAAMPQNNVRSYDRPQLEAAIEEMAQQVPEKGVSGRRMAMLRWGLPALGGALGLYGLGAMANANAQDEREVVRA